MEAMHKNSSTFNFQGLYFYISLQNSNADLPISNYLAFLMKKILPGFLYQKDLATTLALLEVFNTTGSMKSRKDTEINRHPIEQYKYTKSFAPIQLKMYKESFEKGILPLLFQEDYLMNTLKMDKVLSKCVNH